MTVLEKFIQMQLPLFELYDRLAALPSPRMRFAQRLQYISGLSLSSVMVMLSSSDHYNTPHIDIQNKIAVTFKSTVDELFPSIREKSGSLAYRYYLESGKQVELNQMIDLIASVTYRSKRTVHQWMKDKRIPHSISKHRIASVLGVPIHKLFPTENEGKQ